MRDRSVRVGSSRAVRGALLVLLCGVAACGSAERDASAPPFDAGGHDDAGGKDAGGGDAGNASDGGNGVDAGDAGSGVCAGKADGTPCGDATSTECNGADTCQQGECTTNVAANGTACGDATSTECNGADTCQQGECTTNAAADGTACGDATSSACSLPDTCKQGACVPNHAAAGTACGSAAVTDCDGADTCDGLGACQPNATANGGVCYDCAQGGGLCATCNSGACSSASQCTAAPSTSLEAPAVNNNGQDGNMFDIVATSSVVITGFEGNIANTPSATTEYWVYYKVGTHVGFEGDAGAWTPLAGPLQITPNAPNTFTPIIDGLSVVIPAGQTYAFYLSNTSAATNNNRYHNGTSTGNTAAADANITIKEGTGGAYPFGTFFNARVWEGRVHYKPALATAPTGAVASDGVMFDISAAAALSVSGLDVHLATGTHALEVYFRRGTHVGAETNPALWHLLGAQTGVVGNATSPTTVPFATDIRLDAGERAALYVTTGAGSSGVLSRAGTAVGTAVTTSTQATLHEGVAVTGSFGTVGAVSVGEAAVVYDACTP